MELSRELIPVIGSVLGASIAGAIAFIASVFTKEAKTSEFRQNWIEGLRNDVAELASLYHHITSTVDLAAEAGVDTNELLQSLKPEFLKVELMQARIELKLNPSEHKALIELLRRTVRLSGISDSDVSAHAKAVENLLGETQKVLKSEWKRVKSGEPIYWITKWVSLVIFASALLFSVAVGMGWVDITVAP